VKNLLEDLLILKKDGVLEQLNWKNFMKY